MKGWTLALKFSGQSTDAVPHLGLRHSRSKSVKTVGHCRWQEYVSINVLCCSVASFFKFGAPKQNLLYSK